MAQVIEFNGNLWGLRTGPPSRAGIYRQISASVALEEGIDGRNRIPRGVYFYRLQADDWVSQRKVVLLNR
jgi:hypothetical protein